MEKLLYWIKKTLNANWKHCKGFCVTCKYFNTCKSDKVLD